MEVSTFKDEGGPLGRLMEAMLAIPRSGKHCSARATTGGGGVQTSGFPIWTCPSCFVVLFCPFWDFPDFGGISYFVRGILPICPCSLARPINSTYEEQSRKGPRHNPDLFRESGKHPGLEPPPG